MPHIDEIQKTPVLYALIQATPRYQIPDYWDGVFVPLLKHENAKNMYENALDSSVSALKRDLNKSCGFEFFQVYLEYDSFIHKIKDIEEKHLKAIFDVYWDLIWELNLQGEALHEITYEIMVEKWRRNNPDNVNWCVMQLEEAFRRI